MSLATFFLFFRWTFNNSAEAKQVEERFIHTNGSKSILTFTPTRTLEYGTLMCWSRNPVGEQSQPCVFHIIAAGKKRNNSWNFVAYFDFLLICCSFYGHLLVIFWSFAVHLLVKCCSFAAHLLLMSVGFFVLSYISFPKFEEKRQMSRKFE